MRFQSLLPFFSSALADCKGDSDYRVANNWHEQSGDGKNQKFESFLTLHLPDHDIDSWDITVHFKVSDVFTRLASDKKDAVALIIKPEELRDCAHARLKRAFSNAFYLFKNTEIETQLFYSAQRCRRAGLGRRCRSCRL